MRCVAGVNRVCSYFHGAVHIVNVMCAYVHAICTNFLAWILNTTTVFSTSLPTCWFLITTGHFKLGTEHFSVVFQFNFHSNWVFMTFLSILSHRLKLNYYTSPFSVFTFQRDWGKRTAKGQLRKFSSDGVLLLAALKIHVSMEGFYWN